MDTANLRKCITDALSGDTSVRQRAELDLKHVMNYQPIRMLLTDGCHACAP